MHCEDCVGPCGFEVELDPLADVTRLTHLRDKLTFKFKLLIP
jgi:hypothetical protein